MAHDPHYLDLPTRCLSEVDVGHKARLYEELAQLTLAPVGRLSTVGQTAVEVGPGFGTGNAPVNTFETKNDEVHHDINGAIARLRDIVLLSPSAT